ncbi:hypothetical protein BDF22DRAFT_705195 [Syncephalis plumigaleata]|nr:hypothetical protein BDF22DRAFT_705195 [Syncephalis plumigaleata]
MKKTVSNLGSLLDLCKRRGFLLPSYNLYNGLRGALDYGPLGVELKRAIHNEWWRAIVDSRDDVHGVDTPIITPREVLKASGHEGGFSDPLVDCRLSRERFRADKAPALRVERVESAAPGKDEVIQWRVPINAPDKLKARNWLQLIEEKLAPGANVVRDGRNIYLYLNEPPIVPGIEVVSVSSRAASTPVDSTSSSSSDNHQQPPYQHQLLLQSKANPAVPIPLAFYGYAEPNSNSPFLTEPRAFNLMFRTHIGVGEVDAEHSGGATITNEALGSLVYLRPETAQGIFSNFPLLHRAAGQPALPFGIAQYGKSFRNEIRTEKSAFRTCEFEQLELEYFIPPSAEVADQWLERWRQWRLAWWRAYAVNGGQTTTATAATTATTIDPNDNNNNLLDDNIFRLRAHESNELAHYAKACYDIEYRFPWGWGEIEGVANRGDHDLRQHAEAIRSLAGLELPYAIDEKGKPRKGIPWVIEASAGLNRACLVYLLDAYTVETVTTEASPTERTYLRLHPRIAPVQVAVTPLLRNATLLDTARKISTQLRWLGLRTVLDTTSASIGRRYARQDEAGTPWCVTVDFEADGQVTLRERDSMQQTRVSIDQVAHLLRSRLDNTGFKPPLDI